MALLKGRFIDSSEPIKLSANPVSGEDVARKVYVDTTAASEAAAAQAAAESYVDQKISELINSSPAALDTLKELADALGQDANFATTISTQLGELDDKIEQEIADRETAVANEQALREADIAAEASARQTADTAESAARAAGDSALDAKITTEKERAEAEEERIEAKVDEEVSDREAAVANLQSQIDELDSGNAAGLAQEITDRQAGDANLQTQITTEKERVDAILLASEADKDSFAEIVQLINSVDTENDSAFASYVLSNNAALEAEESARESADTALGGRIDGVEADLAAEESARQSGDQTLQSNIDAEEARAEGEEARIEAKVDQEILDRQTAVSNEQSRAQAEEARIEGKVDAEETRAEAAEAALDARLDALEAAPQLQGQKVSFELTAQDLANGYVEMAHEPMAGTMMVVVSGIVHTEEEDYSLSTTSGTTRVTFMGDLVSKLQEGDKVRVQFLKFSASGDEGGGGGGGGGGQPSVVLTNISVSEDTSIPAEVSFAYTGNVSNYYVRRLEGGSWNTVIYEPNHTSGSPITVSITRPASGSGLTSYRVTLNTPEGQSAEQEFTVAEAPPVAAEDLAVSATTEDKANSPYAGISYNGWGVLNIQTTSPSSGAKVYIHASFNGGTTWNLQNELNPLPQQYEPANLGGSPTLIRVMLVKDIGSGSTPVHHPNYAGNTVNVTVIEEVQLTVANF